MKKEMEMPRGFSRPKNAPNVRRVYDPDFRLANDLADTFKDIDRAKEILSSSPKSDIIKTEDLED